MTTATQTIYDQLHDLAAPLITRYMDDLTKHDRNALEANPGMPFLHFTRDSGTHISFHMPANEYPKKGEYVPYLFGHADRDHLLEEASGIVNHYAKPYNDPPLMVLYYNGKTLRKIDLAQAAEIVRDYQGSVRAAWNRKS